MFCAVAPSIEQIGFAALRRQSAWCFRQIQAGTAGSEYGADKPRVYSLRDAHLGRWLASKFVYSPSIGVVQVDEMQHLTVRPGQALQVLSACFKLIIEHQL